MEKRSHATTNPKKVAATVLISHKVDFQTWNIVGNEERYIL